IDTEPFRVRRIESMLDIDKCRNAAVLLCLRNYGKSKSCLSGGFRAKHFDNPTPWKSANAKRAIDQNVACGNNVDVDDLFVAKSHDRAIAVIFRNLLNRKIEILISRSGEFVGIDRWIELERAPEVFCTRFVMNQCSFHRRKMTAPDNCQLVVLD